MKKRIIVKPHFNRFIEFDDFVGEFGWMIGQPSDDKKRRK